MRRMILPIGILLTFLAGCPGATTPAGPVARITLNPSSGTPPLMVFFSSLSSTAPAEIVATTWDFGDGTTDTSATPTHIYSQPGRYVVTLTIEDATGATAKAQEDVRVQGQTPTAVISASVTSGAAPLGVLFDGTGSSAPDDTIFDYFWDFGDGQTARTSMPLHIYQTVGTYTVTLRVVTGGGAEASTTATITVTAQQSASLQFDGSQVATLPVSAGQTLAAWTFEIQARPDPGGQVVQWGTPNVAINLDVDAREVRIVANAITGQLTTPDLGSGWHHLAVAFDGGVVEVYIDGASIGQITLDATTASSDLLVGLGFRGKLADVRFWSVRRTAAEIAAGISSAPVSDATGLLGHWRFDEGSGQSLGNRATGGSAGVRGTTASSEVADPAWSTDAP